MTAHATLIALRAVEAEEGAPGLDQRRALLAELRRVVLKHAQAIADAAAADYGARSAEDTLLADVLLVADACAYSRRKLRRWARPQRAAVPFPFFPARAWVEPAPKGVIGIMAPWNYPVQLALMPAIDAIAAGNRVVIKPSEAAPRVAALLETILAEAWGARIARVVQGGPEVAQDFAAQPWDHLVFTGGTEIGRRVMAAAAANLTPLTLELGGKCPALVLPGADLKRAARNILIAKAVNAGQTCIAPDTVLLIGHSAAEFARAARESGVSETGTAIINPRQQARLDALSEGATIAWMAPGPHSIGLALAQGGLAEQEIFGPILAMLECATLAEALAWVRENPHPLAIYTFGATAAEEAQIAAGTKSGALVSERAVEYAALPGLGFGGVGASGFGRRNGEAGFREFSNPRARVRNPRWAMARLFDRPQSAFAKKLIRQLVGIK